MARSNKHKAVEIDRSKKRKKRVVDESENKNYSEEAVEASVRDELGEIEIEARIDEEALILPHCTRFISAERPACFGLKEFALITGLNYRRYPRDSKYVEVMKEGEAFFKKIAKKRSINVKRLLKLIKGGRLDKEDKFKCCLVWFVHCILFARDLSKIVDIDIIKIVDNLSFFERYSWG
ncbi:hypothetical protein P3L10_002471 [Capsicum annuum]